MITTGTPEPDGAENIQGLDLRWASITVLQGSQALRMPKPCLSSRATWKRSGVIVAVGCARSSSAGVFSSRRERGSTGYR